MATQTKDICKCCGADRNLLREMLAEPPVFEDVVTPGIGGCMIHRKIWVESENHAMAKHILSLCESCSNYFNEAKVR